VQTALITGITGQDGFHLTKLLAKNNYKIIGITSGADLKRLEYFKQLYPDVKIYKTNLLDMVKMENILNSEKPDEIYNLAAVSSVAMSIREPELTHKINHELVINLLNLIYSSKNSAKIKFYQSSSSEMFGGNEGKPINENTEFRPVSPYGESKAKAHIYCNEFRTKHKAFISQGIMFNHESEFRQPSFVSMKIIDNLINIKRNVIKNFELGDIRPARDWGYAGDYVEAIYLMMKSEVPSDYVIASGKSYSIKEFVESAIAEIGLPGKINDYVRSDPGLIRKSEFFMCVGNPSKANAELHWKAKYDFHQLIRHISSHRELLIDIL